MRGVLAADWIKMKHTWIKILVVLGPFGVISLNGLRYVLLYDHLVVPGADNWSPLIRSIHALLLMALMLGIGILAALNLSVEHQENNWKQLFAQPVPKYQIYLSKFIWLALLLAISGALTAAGTVILGLCLGFDSQIPWNLVLAEGFGPYLAAYGVIAIQLLLSANLSNQAIPLIVGVAGLITSMLTPLLPGWLPWSFPYRATPIGTSDMLPYVGYGVSMGIGLLIFGAALFSRQETK
ncbi:MAG: hypothetical protein JWN30_613 [Bacilli bacterium]|nr:hypothetical protein [Bacilli bacterium]